MLVRNNFSGYYPQDNENSFSKYGALVTAIIHSILHILIGPLEFITIIIFVAVGTFDLILLFLLFLGAALFKLGVLFCTYYKIFAKVDQIPQIVYVVIFIGALGTHIFTWPMVAFGNTQHSNNNWMLIFSAYSIDCVLMLITMAFDLFFIFIKPQRIYYQVVPYFNENVENLRKPQIQGYYIQSQTNSYP